jgi:hypothetical protein
MYVIPEAFRSNPMNFHNRGLFSVWAHFVEYCLHNSVFYTKRYRDITSEPFFQTSAYRENPHVPGAKRLDVFVHLSLGISIFNRSHLGAPNVGLVEEVNAPIPSALSSSNREESEDDSTASNLRTFSMSARPKVARKSWPEVTLKQPAQIYQQSIGANIEDNMSNWPTPAKNPADTFGFNSMSFDAYDKDAIPALNTHQGPAIKGTGSPPPEEYFQYVAGSRRGSVQDRFSPQRRPTLSPDSVILSNRSIEYTMKENDVVSHDELYDDSHSSFWEGMHTDSTKVEPWIPDYAGAADSNYNIMDPSDASFSSISNSHVLASTPCQPNVQPFPPIIQATAQPLPKRNTSFMGRMGSYQAEKALHAQRAMTKTEDMYSSYMVQPPPSIPPAPMLHTNVPPLSLNVVPPVSTISSSQQFNSSIAPGIGDFMDPNIRTDMGKRVPSFSSISMKQQQNPLFVSDGIFSVRDHESIPLDQYDNRY